MYEYKFVKVELRGTLRLDPKESCQTAIDECGKPGWKLLEVIVPPNIRHGTTAYYELIFEREI